MDAHHKTSLKGLYVLFLQTVADSPSAYTIAIAALFTAIQYIISAVMPETVKEKVNDLLL